MDTYPLCFIYKVQISVVIVLQYQYTEFKLQAQNKYTNITF